jgi:beta-lactamase regulating signal transducer with metallopeptidase domain
MLETFQSPAWRPLACTLLHFLWQGAAVALAWVVLFRLFRNRTVQARYLLGLAGMFLMVACPVATFVFLESETREDSVGAASTLAASPITSDLPELVPLPASDRSGVQEAPWQLNLAERIGDVQPYLLCGWIAGLTLLSGRLLLGVAGVQRLKRGRTALSGGIAGRTAVIAARLGFRKVPRVFSSTATHESIVTGLLWPMVLLPAAWLAEMSPEVLEAVIAHELAHIRRYDLWLNLFQRVVETLLFYHPAVWWLSRRVRLAREMCCDELAAAATGERVVYATALELAARKRLEPTRSLLEVALGVTRMTLLDRVRNVLGLAVRHEEGRWWPAALLTLIVPAAVWLVSTAAVTSADEEKPTAEQKEPKEAKPQRATATPKTSAPSTAATGRHGATAFLRIAMQEAPMMGGAVQVDRDRFEIYKNTQAAMLTSSFVIRAALKNPEIAKLPSIERQKASGDPVKWLADRLQVAFPGKAEIMKVTFYGPVESREAVVLVNAVVNAYMNEVVILERNRKQGRLSELEKITAEKEQETRKKREALRSMAEGAGSSDPETLSVKQKLALEELALNRQEWAKFQANLRQYEVDLAVQKAYLPEAKDNERPVIAKEIKRLEVSLKVAHEQADKMAEQLKKMTTEAANFGVTSIGMEMLKTDIKRLDTVMSQLTTEIEKLKVDINSAPRITILQWAE